MLSGIALALAVASAILIRGGIKGYDFADSFRDVFSRVPQTNVAPPTGTIDVGPRGQQGSVTEGNFPANVERWRDLVASHFPPNVVDEALSVMECESSGNPTAQNASSGAAGLFQHIPRYWAERSRSAGVPGANIFDPTANVKVAAWLYKQSGTWDHWECKPLINVRPFSLYN